MAKANNDVARTLQNLLYKYEDLLQEVESTLKACGLNKKSIIEFIGDTGVKSDVETLQDYFEHANSLHESVVHDTYTVKDIDSLNARYAQNRTFVNEQLAQKVSEIENEKQRQ